MKTIIALLLILTANYSIADGLYTGAWSYHSDKEFMDRNKEPLTEDNELLAYEYKTFYAGHMINSRGHSTYLAGKFFKLYRGHDLSFGVIAGVSYGYRSCIGPENGKTKPIYCAIAIPEIRYTKYDLQPSILILSNGAAISLRWEIDN